MTVKLRSVYTFSLASVILIPAAYYSYVEIRRSREIRRRRKRYETFKSTSTLDDSSEILLAETKLAFGSLVLGGRWSNPFPEWRESGVWELIFWKVIYQPYTLKVGYNGGVPKDVAVLRASLPVDTPDFDRLFIKSESDEESAVRDRTGRRIDISDAMSITWIGQSTSYIQMEGVAFLTDPVFADRTIESFVAAPRLRPPPCSLDSLLTIDIVLISHDHFDHLHPEIITLGNSVTYVVPLGLSPFFLKRGIDPAKIVEMDWWDSHQLTIGSKEFTITCVPAMHWTARGLSSVNQSLWCSFIVKGSERSFAHIGDTGYSSSLYKAIGEVCGPVDLATIPIGSYEPRWHMSTQHCNPDDAVQIHRDIKSKRSIGVHWGTWILSDEHYLEPPQHLERACTVHGIPATGVFDWVNPGKTIYI